MNWLAFLWYLGIGGAIYNVLWIVCKFSNEIAYGGYADYRIPAVLLAISVVMIALAAGLSF